MPDQASEKGVTLKEMYRSSDLLPLLHDWLNKKINNDLWVFGELVGPQIFEQISERYQEVPAAGGLVLNELNEMLFIFRSGFWDLPKGHVEPGETFMTTAIREVKEETGILNIHIVNELQPTRHLYFMKGRWQIKLTHWFQMRASSNEILQPQLSEGIVKADWIGKEQVGLVLEGSYRSVREMLGPGILQLILHHR